MPGVSSAFQDFGTSLQEIFSSLLNKIIFAAIIILVGFIIGRLLGKLAKHLLHEVGLDGLMSAVGVRVSVEAILSSIIAYSVYFAAVVMALDTLGLNTLVFSILAGGVIAVVLLSTLLAVKDFIPNLFAGFFIYRRRILRAGDHVIVDNTESTVVKVDLMEVKFRTKNGDIIFIPNSLLIKKQVIKKGKA